MIKYLLQKQQRHISDNERKIRNNSKRILGGQQAEECLTPAKEKIEFHIEDLNPPIVRVDTENLNSHRTLATPTSGVEMISEKSSPDLKKGDKKVLTSRVNPVF